MLNKSQPNFRSDQRGLTGPITAEYFAFVNSCLLKEDTSKKHVNSAFFWDMLGI